MSCSVSFSCENGNAFLSLDAMNRTQNDEENFRILFGPAIAPLTDKRKKDFHGVKPGAVPEFQECEDAGCGLQPRL